MDSSDVLVIGGGLAGLAAARAAADEGASVLLLEGSDRVGGRVRSDRVDGFVLDRGFQVLLEAYPEARRHFDYEALELRRFFPGALVREGGRFHRVADPMRRPLAAVMGAGSPVGTLRDKLRVAALRREVLRGQPDELLLGPQLSIEADLLRGGFSRAMIETFFRPFLAGVLLDPELEGPARLFRYYFRMFADGATSVPARGMEELPRAIAVGLPVGTVQTGARVSRIEGPKAPGRAVQVVLEGGEVLEAGAVVVAAEQAEAARLLPELVREGRTRGVTTLYYDAPEPPTDDPILVLDGERTGPVNHLAAMDRASEALAPAGRSLVSANVVDAEAMALPEEELDEAARRQMRAWFGSAVGEWRLLRRYRIDAALPLETPESFEVPQRPSRVAPGVFVAGDHRENPSINGALSSGRRAGLAAARELVESGGVGDLAEE